MRYPASGLSEDDLSRLTDSSSSTASCNSSCSSSPSSSCAAENYKEGQEKDIAASQKYHLGSHQQTAEEAARLTNRNDKNIRLQANETISLSHHRFSSSYLPEYINPLEWQKSRKRKERLDSASSTAQDRKLQRSNSEELVPQEVAHLNATGNVVNAGSNALKVTESSDVIRRVFSEDFKRSSSYAAYVQELRETIATDCRCGEDDVEANQVATVNENDASLANCQKKQHEPIPSAYSEVCNMARHTLRCETSPARSQNHSPVRSAGNNDSIANGKLRDSDDSECEHEKRRCSERFSKTRAPHGRRASGIAKKNNGSSSAKYLLPTERLNDENVYKYDLSALKNERRGFISTKVEGLERTASANDLNDNNLSNPATAHETLVKTTPIAATATPSRRLRTSNPIPLPTSAQEALPWDRSVPEDQVPVLSQRYSDIRHHSADSTDTAAKLSEVMPFPQYFHKQSVAQLLVDDIEPLNNLRSFTSLENMRTREVMQQVIPAIMSFQSPGDRLKQVNKRLMAMKKKLAQLEEAYELRLGYRPSQAERLNDKYMKNILSELSKLRKERREFKSDPMCALGVKVSGGMDAFKKLEKMKLTLLEIEQSLIDKREDANRSEVLEELTPNQLVLEKTAVQHGLLYFESQYGRPATKDERDVARPLYDRYRQLKRLVSRNVTLSCSAVVGAPELPTILEHEAMVFEPTLQQHSSNSTETTNSPSDIVAPPTASSDDSTTSTTASRPQQVTLPTENISDLSIEQLWEHLEKTRSEKKLLKRSIREYEIIFEEQNGRKMLKNDRKTIEETYAQYKEKKAKARLLQALIKKQISR